MKIVSFNDNRIGVLAAGGVIDVSDLSGIEPGFWPPVGMVRFIADFDALQTQLTQALHTRTPLSMDDVRLETPVSWPNKVIAFPANYHAHIDEMGSGLISTFKASGQGFFLKANSSLSGPNDPIDLPDVPEREIHHECELAIIIGKGGRDISRRDALAHIFGYSCLLDIVIRGKEERVMRKSFDSFCPVGPWITTVDEISDPANIALSLKVNGELRQQASTRDLIVDIPEMIAMASSVMTLMPGDIIATGTPAGVARIEHGDQLRIEIEGVGAMDITVNQGSLGRHPVWDKSAA